MTEGEKKQIKLDNLKRYFIIWRNGSGQGGTEIGTRVLTPVPVRGSESA